MANTGQPHTGGSQFFLVYKDSKLPPSYTPFGTMDAAGLKVVQDVAKAGVAGGAEDGAPKKAVTIEKAAVTEGVSRRNFGRAECGQPGGRSPRLALCSAVA